MGVPPSFEGNKTTRGSGTNLDKTEIAAVISTGDQFLFSIITADSALVRLSILFFVAENGVLIVFSAARSPDIIQEGHYQATLEKP
jgi:hypothetical protein